MLRQVTALLHEIALPDAKYYRIGGDEFLIAIDAAVTPEMISAHATDIIRRIERPMLYRGHASRVGSSLGIAFGLDAGFDAAATLMNADLALYRAKRDGKNTFRFFTTELQEVSQKRRQMSDLILGAIDAELFVPFYQPQYFAGGLELRGVEVLCRWKHPTLGWIAPSEFLPVAEDLKVVGSFDKILFGKVTKDVLILQQQGLVLPKVSFNLTADRLLLSNLANELDGAFGTKTKIAVELLESISLDNLTESMSFAIDTLKERGIGIEIDDFGSCRASVAGLMSVSPNAMKIDQSIIRPISSSERHLNLMKEIIEIGRALNIEVIAEGVETDAHIEILQGLGCDVLQGFALAKPMPLDQLIKLLKKDGAVSDVDDIMFTTSVVTSDHAS